MDVLPAAVSSFEAVAAQASGRPLTAARISTIQANLGPVCNQRCAHCHLAASPDRRESMSWETMELLVAAADQCRDCLVDITGGAPELHPDFRKLVAALRTGGHGVQVRTNLTVLLEDHAADLAEFLRDNAVTLVASLPCYLEQNVDEQRGAGVYGRSIEALGRLNAVGYGMPGGLSLDLVYSPVAASLPPDQDGLEADYREELRERFGVEFSRLRTITNMPIGRFRERLRSAGELEQYAVLLRESFNPATLDGLMCRHQVSVGWDGTLYDCDFNLAIDQPVDGDAPRSIREFDHSALTGRRICTGEHCFGCTAGNGSSCGGALV